MNPITDPQIITGRTCNFPVKMQINDCNTDNFIKTNQFYRPSLLYCCPVVRCILLLLPSKTEEAPVSFVTAWQRSSPRVSAKLWSEHILLSYLGADGTHLTETRFQVPGVKSPFFSVTRSWQKVGDSFIWTAGELLTSRVSHCHEMKLTERGQRARTRHKAAFRCLPFFSLPLWRLWCSWSRIRGSGTMPGAESRQESRLAKLEALMRNPQSPLNLGTLLVSLRSPFSVRYECRDAQLDRKGGTRMENKYSSWLVTT